MEVDEVIIEDHEDVNAHEKEGEEEKKEEEMGVVISKGRLSLSMIVLLLGIVSTGLVSLGKDIWGS